MSLYLKYRPKTFKDVKGNTKEVKALEEMCGGIETCPHTFLMHGETGCGKTTLARIIKDALCIHDVDLKEINSSNFNGVDMIRSLINELPFAAMAGDRKMYILDEVHQLSAQAQDALLKSLEDTPPHVYFVLCTTNPEKLKKAVRGRCQEVQVEPLSVEDMKSLLKKISRKEKNKVSDEILEQIAEVTLGHPRNAINLLEKIHNTPEEDRLSAAKKVEEVKNESIELCRALMSGKPWKTVAGILKGLKGQDAEGIRRAVLGYSQAVILNKPQLDVVACLILEEFNEPTYNSGFPQLVLSCASVLQNRN